MLMFNKRPYFSKPRPYNSNRPYTPRPRQQVFDPFEKDHPKNEAIPYNEMRVIDENGENLGVMNKADALALAKERELDLVVYAAQANPPVCKIVEWDAFKYHIKKKEKEIKKNQKIIKVKEIKISPKIASFDLDRKVEKILEIVNKGDQVKITIMRKYPTTPEQANTFKDTMLTKLTDYCTIISVQQKGKNIYVLVKSKPVTNAKAKD